jgi:hypothetical protein
MAPEELRVIALTEAVRSSGDAFLSPEKLVERAEVLHAFLVASSTPKISISITSTGTEDVDLSHLGGGLSGGRSA